MSLGQQIRSGVAWLMFGNTGSQALQFLFGIALARLLVPADFGMIATIQILTGFVSLVSSGGMGQSLIRAKQADTRDFDGVFTIQLGLGILICAGIFLIAPWFARFFGNPLYADLLGISALNFLLRPFALIRSAWLNREMDFRKAAAANLATTAVSGASSVGMALAGLGVWSLSLGGLTAALTTNLMLYFLTPLRLRVRFDAQVARRHSGFGFRITMLDLIAHVHGQSVALILSKLAGPALLGLFNKGESLARMSNRMITPATGQVVFRALSKVADDFDQSRYLMYRTISLLSLYVFPFLVYLVWTAEPLIRLLYGERWLPAAEPARILAIGGFFLTSLRPCARLLEAQNRLRPEMLVETVVLVFGVSACYFGLRWGLAGVAWAVVCTNVLHALLMYWAVHRTIPTRVVELLRAVAPAFFLSGLLAIALAALDSQIAPMARNAPLLYLAAMGALGGLVYGLAFLFLPIPALQSEAARWRRIVSMGFGSSRRRRE